MTPGVLDMFRRGVPSTYTSPSPMASCRVFEFVEENRLQACKTMRPDVMSLTWRRYVRHRSATVMAVALQTWAHIVLASRFLLDTVGVYGPSQVAGSWLLFHRTAAGEATFVLAMMHPVRRCSRHLFLCCSLDAEEGGANNSEGPVLVCLHDNPC